MPLNTGIAKNLPEQIMRKKVSKPSPSRKLLQKKGFKYKTKVLTLRTAPDFVNVKKRFVFNGLRNYDV